MDGGAWRATMHGVAESPTWLLLRCCPPGSLIPAKSPFRFLNETPSVCATHTLLLLCHLTAGETRPWFPLHRPTPVICRAPDKSARDAGLGRHSGEASETTCFKKEEIRSSTVSSCTGAWGKRKIDNTDPIFINISDSAFIVDFGYSFSLLAYCIQHWFVLVAAFWCPLTFARAAVSPHLLSASFYAALCLGCPGIGEGVCAGPTVGLGLPGQGPPGSRLCGVGVWVKVGVCP